MSAVCASVPLVDSVQFESYFGVCALGIFKNGRYVMPIDWAHYLYGGGWTCGSCQTFASNQNNPQCIIPRPATIAKGEGWKEVNAKDNLIELLDAEATYLRKSGWTLISAYGMEYLWRSPDDGYDSECEWDHAFALRLQKKRDWDSLFEE